MVRCGVSKYINKRVDYREEHICTERKGKAIRKKKLAV
jgi:hypothetical protein